jgi:predicted PurR-regulated permease PerM
MAMLFLPVANFLEKRLRFTRSMSTIASVLMMLILTGLIYFFGSQLSDFSKDIPHLKKQFTSVAEDIQHWVSRTFHVKIDEQLNYIDQGLNKLFLPRSYSGIYFWIFSSSLGFFCFLFCFSSSS